MLLDGIDNNLYAENCRALHFPRVAITIVIKKKEEDWLLLTTYKNQSINCRFLCCSPYWHKYVIFLFCAKKNLKIYVSVKIENLKATHFFGSYTLRPEQILRLCQKLVWGKIWDWVILTPGPGQWDFPNKNVSIKIRKYFKEILKLGKPYHQPLSRLPIVNNNNWIKCFTWIKAVCRVFLSSIHAYMCPNGNVYIYPIL